MANEAIGIDAILELLGGADAVREVEIENIHGQKKMVSLKVPIARTAKALAPINSLKDKVTGLTLTPPARGDNEDDESYQMRRGMVMLEAFVSAIVALMGQDLIDCAAAILGEESEFVGENYEAQELVAVAVPFLKRSLGGMINRVQGSLLPGGPTDGNGSGSLSESSSGEASSLDGSEKT